MNFYYCFQINDPAFKEKSAEDQVTFTETAFEGTTVAVVSLGGQPYIVIDLRANTDFISKVDSAEDRFSEILTIYHQNKDIIND